MTRALGITCLEMAEGRPPYSEESSMEAIIKIITKDPPNLAPESWNEPLRAFIADCLQKEPANRPTAEQLLKSHKALWAKAKDGKYLMTTLKLKEFPIKILRDSSDRSTQASHSFENTNSNCQKSSITWNFNLDEQD
jgi:serine/threonine protein kinase